MGDGGGYGGMMGGEGDGYGGMMGGEVHPSLDVSAECDYHTKRARTGPFLYGGEGD